MAFGLTFVYGRAAKRGFTLIEVSIVLVIIGLIIGGVVVGQDLIAAATIRSQISQIEKYNTAVNTFRGKYGHLPGDIPDPEATQYGLLARGTDCDGSACPGEGNGNDVIEGLNVFGSSGIYQAGGETVMIWVDLATANLIAFDAADSDATPNGVNCMGGGTSGCLPSSKLGDNIYIYVWSGGLGGDDGQNYYAIASVQAIQSANGAPYTSTPGLTVSQAYNMDQKVDDGLPQSGHVMAMYVNSAAGWAPNDTSASSSTCFDTTSGAYSIGTDNGNDPNCALSFRFQ